MSNGEMITRVPSDEELRTGSAIGDTVNPDDPAKMAQLNRDRAAALGGHPALAPIVSAPEATRALPEHGSTPMDRSVGDGAGEHVEEPELYRPRSAEEWASLRAQAEQEHPGK